MSDVIFNIAKGAAAEKARDDATKFLVLLLKVDEGNTGLIDRATVSAILGASNTEANFTNYARKTGITATLAVDNTNDWVTLDMPDQTWTTAGGATNNTLTKLIIAYEEAAADSTRVPISAHDFAVTTDASDLTAQVATAGFYKAA